MSDLVVAPVVPGWSLRSSDVLRFDAGLSLEPMPSDVRLSAGKSEVLSRWEKDRFTEAGYAFVHKSGAVAEDESQPFQRITCAALSLWISQPVPPPGTQVSVTFKRLVDGWEATASKTRQPMHWHRGDVPYPTPFENSGFDCARDIYLYLLTMLNGADQVWIAVQTLYLALRSDFWVLRFATLWIALECLFGNSRPGSSVTKTLSQRIGFFLARDRAEARKLVRIVEESYQWRSSIVHGRHPDGMKKLVGEEEPERLAREVEDLIRRALFAIFRESFEGRKLFDIFNDPGQRTNHLDALLYTR